jgi:predicted aspartyl protease
MNVKKIVTGTPICRWGILFLFVSCFCSAAVAQQVQKMESGVSLISDPKTGTILIPAKLNARPVMMILDTGASHSIFDARAFGVAPVQLQAARMNSRGLGLDADVVLRVADVQIADLQWKQKSLEIADLSKLSKIYGRTIDGLVGQDLLRTFTSVQINYVGGCVMLQR